MRALSLRCPFPWLMVKGYKPWENRSWNTNKRGWVLVHASRQYSVQDLLLARELIQRLDERPPEPVAQLYTALVQGQLASLQGAGAPLQTGGIVGAVRIDSVHPPILSGYAEPLPDWRILHQYGFKIGAAEEIPFTPCSGKQGFWRVSFHLQRVLEEKTPAWLWAELQKND